VLSRTTSETLTTREKNEKMEREDSSLVTEFSTKEFEIYMKKTKTSSKVDFTPREETEGTIVLSSLHTLQFGSITIDSPSSSTTKENLTTTPHTIGSFIE